MISYYELKEREKRAWIKGKEVSREEDRFFIQPMTQMGISAFSLPK